MRYLFALGALFLFLPFCLDGQVKNIMLNGHIIVTGGESLTYTLVFTDSANILNGYSVTTQGDYEAKAAITGQIYPAKHMLRFNETSIIYTHGTQNGGLTCLIGADLIYSPSVSGHILHGPFTGSDYANAVCGTGTITFTNNDVLSSLFSSSAVAADDEQTTNAAPAKRSGIVVTNDVPESPSVLHKITAGVEKTYEWHNNTVIIDVWDGGHIDGDVVTLLYNDSTILDHYTLTSFKRQLQVPLSKDKTDVLTIVAENEGSEPPNTANLTLTDGDIKYNILAYDKKGQQAIIKIKRAGKK
jgi:hypothetical protein